MFPDVMAHAAFGGEFLGVSARFSAHEERNFLSSFSASASQVMTDVGIAGTGSGSPLLAVARRMHAKMRRTGGVVEFEIVAEHLQQMFFEPHHQWMDPAVEHHVRAFKAHLRE